MSLTLAGIPVPEFPHLEFVFPKDLAVPIPIEFPFVREIAPEVVIHEFGSASAKVEQRFYLGDGVRRFILQFEALTPEELDSLQDFWELTQGGLATFDFVALNPDQTTWEYVRVRFEQQNISFRALENLLITTGVTLAVVPVDVPAYPLNDVRERFPSPRDPDTGTIAISPFADALTGQSHTLIPLLKITTSDPDSQVLYLADRSCTIGGQFYHPRLADWGPISQQVGGGSDKTSFVLGDADRVIAAVASSHQLRDARIHFSLFHVESGIRVDLWAGRIRNYTRNSGPTIPVECDEGVPLQISYPQTNSRTCGKIFGGPDCRWAGGTSSSRTLKLSAINGTPAGKSILDAFTTAWLAAQTLGISLLHTVNAGNPGDQLTITYTFQPDGTKCDQGWCTPNGCLAHLNESNFGAIYAAVQTVRTRDNTTGVMGFGRSILTSASQIADSVYSEVLPEIYMKTGSTTGTAGYPIKAKIVAGRDEGDFYAALGVVGRGPLAEYAVPVFDPNDQNAVVPFTLDGQPWHGVDKNTAGLRWSQGFDPALPQDYFSLGEGGSGPQRYNEGLYAAGIAFVEIRRTDAKGLQLSTPDGHDMEVNVRGGLGGWVWDAPGFRRWVLPLTYPVWVEINVYLRALGLQGSPSAPPAIADQEARFDVASACAAQSQWCSRIVDKLIGQGKEDQFVYTGVLRENKPLRDWLDEIENNFLGYHVWSSGKLRIGVRGNSSSLSGFTDGNILFRSLEFPPVEPAFNSITAQIADEESGYMLIPVSITDNDAAIEAGGGVKQEVRETKLTLSGTSGKSQAARIVTTRLREEIGGITAAQRRALTGVRFKTTILALDTEAGMVVGLTHPDCPNYPPKQDGTLARDNYVEFRIQSWTLSKDFAIDIAGRSTHDDMYDLVYGPKPEDVVGDPVPGQDLFAPANWRCELWCHQDGIVRLNNLACGSNSRSVTALRTSLYYIDEASDKYGTIVGKPGLGNLGGIEDTTQDTFVYNGLAPVPGEWVLCGPEIMEVLTSEPAGADPENFGIFTVKRGALGTIPTATPAVIGNIVSVNPDWPCELSVTAGDWRAGTAVVVDNGTWPAVPAPQQLCTEFLPPGNILRTDLPLQTAAPGSNIYQHPRLWLVKRLDHTTTLPVGFFYTPNRATFEDSFTIENAGIVAVKAYLENSRHLKSKELALFPVSGQRMEPKTDFTPAWPYRVRTLGNAKMLLPDKNMPLGVRTDVFLPVPVSHPQAFDWALATIWRGGTGIIDTPPTIQTIKLMTFEASGHVAIAGSFQDDLQLQIVVAGGNEAQSLTYYLSDHPSVNSTSALVQSIVDWLQNDSVWSDFYKTDVNPSDPTVIDLVDLTGRGGTITVTTNDTSANLDITVSSFSPPLGVMHGRQYALAYVGSGNRSDLSVNSPTTGPTGDATEIQIRDLPMSSDATVTDVEIYAYPDGDTLTMPYLVGSVPNGTPWFVDNTPESALSSQIQYSEPAQPATAGPVLCTVTRNGVAWFQLFIPATANISNKPHGFGIDLIQADSEINVDIDNEAADGISLVLEMT